MCFIAPSRGGRGRRAAVDFVVCFGWGVVFQLFFFKQKTAYEIGVRLVGSEMCIRDRFAAFILLPTRFWPRIDRELPFLAIAQKKSAPPKTHHEVHSSPATATTSRRSPATATISRRRATKHVPRVSPYSPASMDPGFVEFGLVQLSQSVKTTNVAHTHTDRHTDRQTN